MPPINDYKPITFRDALSAEVLSTISGTKFTSVEIVSLLVEMVSNLANYKEEGVPLCPRVYICSDIGYLCRSMQSTECIAIGGGGTSDNMVKTALKQCAPLASANWAIFLEIRGKKVNFGMFSIDADPLSFSNFTPLAQIVNESVILVRQVAPSQVDLTTSNGRHRRFCFTGDQPPGALPIDHSESLAACIASSYNGKNKESLIGYLSSLLSSALDDCHGTIIAVIDHQQIELNRLFSQYVSINPPISLGARVEQHVSSLSSTTLSQLQTTSTLLRNMIFSDGAVVFSNKGELVAFRSLVKVRALKTKGPPGGARTQAFKALAEQVGGQVVCALFRSQDGRREFVSGECK